MEQKGYGRTISERFYAKQKNFCFKMVNLIKLISSVSYIKDGCLKSICTPWREKALVSFWINLKKIDRYLQKT